MSLALTTATTVSAFGARVCGAPALAGEPSILMRPELYVTAAALASGLYVALGLVGLAGAPAAIIAAAAGFTLRAFAIRYHLALPAYRGRG